MAGRRPTPTTHAADFRIAVFHRRYLIPALLKSTFPGQHTNSRRWNPIPTATSGDSPVCASFALRQSNFEPNEFIWRFGNCVKTKGT
jgi:hypothetical protein